MDLNVHMLTCCRGCTACCADTRVRCTTRGTTATTASVIGIFVQYPVEARQIIMGLPRESVGRTTETDDITRYTLSQRRSGNERWLRQIARREVGGYRTVRE